MNLQSIALTIATALTWFQLLTGSLAHAADATKLPALFTEIAGPAAAPDHEIARDPTIFRSRLVKLNWDFKAAADRSAYQQSTGYDQLALNLFEDLSLTAVFEQREIRSNKGFNWLGYVEGFPGSQVTLVVEDGVMACNLRFADEYYQIRYVAADLYAVRQIDESRYPADGDPIPMQSPPSESAQDVIPAAIDDGSTFDVLVVYTPAARAAAGGTTAMSALINLAVAETNTAYSRSGVIPRLRLVHSEEVNYTESGDFMTDLSRLTNPSDNFMDNVHSIRNARGADLVSLIIEGTSLCGIGWLMTAESHAFEPFAFSISARICATGNFTFGHELGHNMGLQHDRADTPQNGVFPYSHGYVDIPHGFRTIMGVQPNPPCCARIQNFANPMVAFNGFPTGISSALPDAADAAASLNATRFTVANWRAEVNGSTGESHKGIDFDGDDHTDIAVYQIDSGNWFFLASSTGFGQHLNFGGSNFVPLPADYDGDGKTDTAVYENSSGNWFLSQSTAGFQIHSNFGGTGFIPVPADFDGDGKTDLAVYQASTGNWFVVGSSMGFRQQLAFGGSDFIPVPGDYDGDGRVDTAVYQMSTGHWFMSQSTAGFRIHPSFGGSGFIPQPGDYDGDGKTDVGVYHGSTGNWFAAGSTAGLLQHINFGGAGFAPVSGDYDGDGRTDTAVYQTSTGNWFISQSTAGFRIQPSFGGTGFVPVLPQGTILRALGFM